MADSPADLSYCGQEVRRHDHDRFLTVLFAPAERREALYALFAFNLEVAKTREVVSEPLIGQMRLQWWRDMVGAAYGEGKVPVHAVAEPLAAAVRDHGLTRDLLDSLIDARERDLDEEPMPDMASLVAYAEATAAPLVRSALEVLGVRDAAAHKAAGHVGAAFALAGVLRAVPFHAGRQRVLLPVDRLRAHAGKPREILDGKPGPAVRAVAKEVAEVARERLAQARSLRRSVPVAAVPALLPATLAGMHLRTLERGGYDVLAPQLHLAHPFRLPALAWARWRGRY